MQVSGHLGDWARGGGWKSPQSDPSVISETREPMHLNQPQPLLVATTNAGKLREITAMLPALRFVTLADWPSIAPPEETGVTFAENARLKALFYAAATGLPTVAEDSGLEVDALGGAPGVKSARFGGAGTSYPEKFKLLLTALRAAPAGGRTARFVCALALADERQVKFEAVGTVEGEIADAPRGSHGFGYDPIFYYAPFGCTFGEAGDRKAAVSHRAQAFAQLKQFLQNVERRT
jgi:XTP/dITP diphosphohydrolase